MEYNAHAGVTTTPAYRIAMGMYVSIGGNPSKVFDSVDAIYAEIDRLFASSGGGTSIITPLDIELIENGTYYYSEDAISGYKPVSVTVDVAQKWTDEQVTQLQQDSYNDGYSEGETKGYNNGYTAGNTDGYADGYADGVDDGAEDQKALLESITITENGTYNREDGWNEVVVEIETDGGGGGAGFDFESIGWDAAYSREINNRYKADLVYSASQIDKVNNGKFQGDTNLVFAPYAPYNGDVYLSNKFANCKKLQYVPKYDTSSVLYMNHMFNGCYSLQTVPQFDTSNVTTMQSMFYDCVLLTTVPQFDTSNVTDMSYMFSGCSSLQTVPQFDTSSVLYMSYMFDGCSSLQTVPQFDTSSVATMQSMFVNCSSLQTVPQFDTSNITYISSMFNGCTNLTDVGGLINLGMQSNLAAPTSKYVGIFLGCKNITRESVLNIFNGLYDRATAGYSNLKLFFEADVINRLTEDDIAIATNKGWTISQ